MREHVKPAFVSFSNYMHTTGSRVSLCGWRSRPWDRKLIAYILTIASTLSVARSPYICFGLKQNPIFFNLWAALFVFCKISKPPLLSLKPLSFSCRPSENLYHFVVFNGIFPLQKKLGFFWFGKYCVIQTPSHRTMFMVHGDRNVSWKCKIFAILSCVARLTFWMDILSDLAFLTWGLFFPSCHFYMFGKTSNFKWL